MGLADFRSVQMNKQQTDHTEFQKIRKGGKKKTTTEQTAAVIDVAVPSGRDVRRKDLQASGEIPRNINGTRENVGGENHVNRRRPSADGREF